MKEAGDGRSGQDHGLRGRQKGMLRDEHADVIRESVRAVVQELMEAEVCELIGAQRGEGMEDRATHRNGYRPRRWDTRAGEIELQIPKIRQGSYFPSFLQPRKRSEQALVSVVQQATSAAPQRAASSRVRLGHGLGRSARSSPDAIDKQRTAFRKALTAVIASTTIADPSRLAFACSIPSRTVASEPTSGV
jgi:putative transposase